MKYLGFAIILACLFSCSPFGFNTAGYEEMDENLYTAWARTSSYTYIAETSDKQYCKSPKEFEADGGGDCEDFTGHLMYYVGEGQAVLVSFTRNGEHIDHYIMKYRGKYIEPQCLGKYIDLDKLGYKVLDTYSWADFMSRITDFGTRDL